MLNNIAALIGGAAPAVGDYESISTTLLTGTQATVTFSGIPATYKHLQIRASVKSNNAAVSSAMGIQFNATTTGYFQHGLYGDGASAGAYPATSSNTAGSFYIAGSTSTSVFGAIIIDILDYADTNKNKTVRALSGADFNGSGQARLSSGSVALTTAITTLTLTELNAGSFVQYSSFALYGIK